MVLYVLKRVGADVMKILHYSLGVSPYRTGGLTKYCESLMSEQIKNGDSVSLLYPGHFNFFEKLNIVRDKSKDNVDIFEIVNPNSLIGVLNSEGLIIPAE